MGGNSAGEPATWSGVFPYVPTPVDGSGLLDLPALTSVLDRAITGEVDGITPLGSSGEIVYLSEADRARVITHVVDTVHGAVPVVPGVTGFSAVQLSRGAARAEGLGADGVLLILTTYFPLSDAEVLTAAHAVSQAVSIPVVMYHHPNVCGYSLTSTLVQNLVDDCGITYIKDASGDPENIVRWRDCTGGAIRIFASTAVSPTAALRAGAVGLMSGPAAVFPREFVDLFRAARSHQWDIAASQEDQMLLGLDFFRMMGPAKAVKAMMRQTGIDVGDPIPPCSAISPAELREAALAVAAMGRRPPYNT